MILRSTAMVLALVLSTGCERQAEMEPTSDAPPVEPTVEPPPADPIEPAAAGTVTVVTLKNGSVEDPHTLRVSGGTLKLADGDAFSSLTGSVEVDLTSWSSAVEIRDQRVKEMFFDVANHPTGRFVVNDVQGGDGLAVGEKADVQVKGAFEVAGHSHEAEVSMAVERVAEAGWTATTSDPVALTGGELGMSDKITAVAEACGVELADEVKLSVELALGEVPAAPTEEAPPTEDAPAE